MEDLHPRPKHLSPALVTRNAPWRQPALRRRADAWLLEYGRRPDLPLPLHALRVGLSLVGVAAWTLAAHRLIPVNATTAGFGYLLLVLVIASYWGFVEALAASVASTLGFNYFFFPPIGGFTIQDPRNWVALLSFLATSVIASRLSALAKRRTLDALARQRDLERLYAFSRAILMIGEGEPFPKQLVMRLAEIFQLGAAVLYDGRTGEFFRAGSSSAEMDDHLRKVFRDGAWLSDPLGTGYITAVRLGPEPVGGLGLGGSQLSEPVVQGIVNLVAIGLERARARSLAQQVEAARQSEELRTTLIDAMAHEFKTPLTSIKAATTSLLALPPQSEESRTELLRIADEEADHLRDLIDDSIDMARLDAASIDLALELSDPGEAVREVIEAMKSGIDSRPVRVIQEGPPAAAKLDRRLFKLAVKQLLDNALKYSPPDSLVTVRIGKKHAIINLDVINCGNAIPLNEQGRVFQRFYRSPAVKDRIPGSGLGLSIAQRIAQAHKGNLTVASAAGQTTFRLSFPVAEEARS